jgi:hypothetical protein
MTFSGSNGEFTMPAMQPGEYYFMATVLPLFLDDQKPKFATTYYPGTTTQSEAYLISVKAGGNVALGDLTLLKPSGAAVHLHLMNISDRDASAGGSIDVRHPIFLGGQGTVRIPFFRNGDGKQIDIAWMPAGHHELLLRTDTPDGRLSKRIGVDIAEADLTMDVAMNPGYSINARVLEEDTAGNRVPIGPGFTLRVRPKLGPTLMPPTKNDGTILLEHVPEGTYKLDFPSLQPDSYVSAIVADQLDILKDGLEIDSDKLLEIVVRKAAGALVGVVRNSSGGKVPSAVAALVPDNSIQSFYKTAVTDTDGGFRFLGVAPGGYHLFAWQALEGAAYENPEFMKTFEDRGIALNIKSGITNGPVNATLVDGY